jgi:ATP-dependent DNA helicase Rep
VLAGAGSGKTRVITHKIGRLIQAGLEPKRIAAITFTNKAAAEMRERAKGLIGKRRAQVVVCTFHALGVRMMREDGAVLGLKPAFSILDSDDVTKILKDAGGTTDTATARIWQWTISKWKNMGLNAAEAEAAAVDDNERITARRSWRATKSGCTAYQSVDFDDLIGMPLKLLRDFDEVRAKWQAALGHILVDEYQDTNATQYEVLKALAGERGRITAVGDDDQSIYGWRGATLDNLRKLPVDYPTLKVIKLEQNYRSTSAILRAANNVIGPNPKLFPKTLFSELGEGEPVRIVDADNEAHEAERAVARIASLRAGDAIIASQGKQYKEFRDFAILYRANHQARVFEQALRKAQIPYKVSGGQSFFDRAEIKDLCGWFRLWVNNDDDPAFLRAITTPKRGIGHTTLASLGTFASQYKLSLFEALFSPSLPSVMPKRTLEGIHEFGRYINDLEYRARRTMGAEDSRTFMLDWLKEIDYEKHLYDGEDSEQAAAARWTNVLEFVDWMSQRAGGTIDDASGANDNETERKSLLEVAQTISLLSTISEREQDQNVVTLSTLHASKGLEWPHVMLIGVTEGLLPFKLDDDNGRQLKVSDETLQRLQEERRLMYVGITRAQRSLAVSWTKKRKQGREMVPCVPSRFIAEMGLDKKPPRKTRAKSSRRCAPSSRARPRTARPRRRPRRRHERTAFFFPLAALCTAAPAPRPSRPSPGAPPRTGSAHRIALRPLAGALRRPPGWASCSSANTPSTWACAAPSRARRPPHRRTHRWPSSRATSTTRACSPSTNRRTAAASAACGRASCSRLVRPRVQGHVAQRRRRQHTSLRSEKDGTDRKTNERNRSRLPLPRPARWHVACFGAAGAQRAGRRQDRASPLADAQLTWQQCAALGNSNEARLACFDRWAQQQTLPSGVGAGRAAGAGEHQPHRRWMDRCPPRAWCRSPPAKAAATASTRRCRASGNSRTAPTAAPSASAATARSTCRFRPPPSKPETPTSPAAGHTGEPMAYQANEMRIGLSVRTKIAQGMLTQNDPVKKDSLWFAYSQQSTWQLFNGDDLAALPHHRPRTRADVCLPDSTSSCPAAGAGATRAWASCTSRTARACRCRAAGTAST